MKILVDTSVWSLAFRRRTSRLSELQERLRGELADLIAEARAEMIGPVRQELLSGIRTDAQYEGLRSTLRSFENAPLETEDYEEAARVSNTCRSHGIPDSPIDFLICAVAIRRGWSIFTTDDDLTRYAKVIHLNLHQPRR